MSTDLHELCNLYLSFLNAGSIVTIRAIMLGMVVFICAFFSWPFPSSLETYFLEFHHQPIYAQRLNYMLLFFCNIHEVEENKNFLCIDEEENCMQHEGEHERVI